MNAVSTRESRTLVRGRYVVCGVREGGDAELVEHGAVLVQAGVVSEVGAWSVLRARHPDAEVVGNGEDLVAPGFINAHHHVGVTPFQLGAPDLPLELWLAAKLGARQVDPYLDTLYSAFEMIASGVTTVQHLHVARCPGDQVPGLAAEILRAYRDIGMRVSYSYGYRDQNRLVYEDDSAFLARLPYELAVQLRLWFDAQHMTMHEQLALFETLHALHHGSDGGRVAVQLAPSNLHWCSDAALLAIGELSHKHQLPMHMHLLETQFQKSHAYQRWGHSAVEHIDHLGLLGPRMTLGHATWANARDIALIAERGACVCHNASSNLRLRSGIAPCNHFLQRGVPVALGIDEASIHDDRDMLQEMRLVLNLHRTPGLDDTAVPSAAQVFRMATEHGARTTGFGAQIGTLGPGRAADLVMHDWSRIALPYLDREVPILEALLRRSRSEFVKTVMIAGRIVYQDGRFAGVDRDDILAQLAASLAQPPTEAERQRRRLSDMVLPHVRQFYQPEAALLAGRPFAAYRYNDAD